MISKTPNLRLMKPLSRYMEKRIRMFGRSRLALEYNRTAQNQKTITLDWEPQSVELLEVYVDQMRMLRGWTLNRNVLTFDVAQNGAVRIIEDPLWPDMDQKWLQIDFNNLVHSENLDETSYGTDRRNGTRVATRVRPVVMMQPGIGFCRPDADGSSLLYSSYFGMYGRDSITYALLADNGQLSDVRCIDVRVRNPNYQPPIRVGVVAKTAQKIKLDGEVYESTAAGAWTVYATHIGNTVIDLPNKTSVDEELQFDFIIQGRDEDGQWFELQEYFDPDEYQIQLAYPTDEFEVVAQGSSAEFGFLNAERLSIKCKQIVGGMFELNLVWNDYSIFQLKINSGPTEFISAANFPITSTQTVVLNPDPEDNGQQVDWLITDLVKNHLATTVTTEFNTHVPGRYPVAELVDVTLVTDVPLYDPLTGLEIQSEFTIDEDISGAFTIAVNPDENLIEYPETIERKLLDAQFVWDQPDPFSRKILFEDIVYTVSNIWTIKPQLTEPEE